MSVIDRVITVCPKCAGMNRHLMCKTIIPKWLKKYYIECDECGYCAPRAFTWRGAVKNWSREWQRRFLKQ